MSVYEVSKKPIKFVGTGEKIDALEPFYPDRMSSRILGMGDMLTLYEKADAVIKATTICTWLVEMECRRRKLPS